MVAAYRPEYPSGPVATKALSGRPMLVFTKGGPGSGNYGHHGRHGQVGGSQPNHAPETGEGGPKPPDWKRSRYNEQEEKI